MRWWLGSWQEREPESTRQNVERTWIAPRSWIPKSETATSTEAKSWTRTRLSVDKVRRHDGQVTQTSARRGCISSKMVQVKWTVAMQEQVRETVKHSEKCGGQLNQRIASKGRRNMQERLLCPIGVASLEARNLKNFSANTPPSYMKPTLVKAAPGCRAKSASTYVATTASEFHTRHKSGQVQPKGEDCDNSPTEER